MKDDSRELVRAQLLLTKHFVEAMNTIRKEYVAMGMDKERDFLEEFLLRK